MELKLRPCQRCNEMIPLERLEALPMTRLCVQCSRETGGDLRLVIRTRTQRKEGSLKRTGVEVESVEWVRRCLPEEV
jgi:hypothetical protein